jgi:hypothetical protein
MKEAVEPFGLAQDRLRAAMERLERFSSDSKLFRYLASLLFASWQCPYNNMAINNRTQLFGFPVFDLKA